MRSTTISRLAMTRAGHNIGVRTVLTANTTFDVATDR